MKLVVHQHLIPPTDRQILIENGVSDVGGRAVPDWTPELAFAEMLDAGIDGAILSVSAPGTTVLTDPEETTRLARTLNDYGAELSRAHPDRIGYFATLPMPGLTAATAEAEYALDTLHADGVILLANARGHYLGQPGQEPLFDALNQRDAIVLIHPAELPGPTVPDLPPFAADFLLDTTRAAYLLVRHEIIRNYPRIRFILSHAGGFLPYAAPAWPSASPATPAAAPATSSPTSAASTSTPRSRPAPPHSWHCCPSRNPTTSSTAATGPSPPLPPSPTSTPAAPNT